MLLREMMSDPFLEHYGAVVIDQAHERTVSTDILLGLLKDILLQRPELRVVVLAVPPTTDKLLRHYGSIPLIRLEASCAAEVVHSNSDNKDYFYSALRLVLEIHRAKEDGDAVVFFASEEVRDYHCAFCGSIGLRRVSQTSLLLTLGSRRSTVPKASSGERAPGWERTWARWCLWSSAQAREGYCLSRPSNQAPRRPGEFSSLPNGGRTCGGL